MEKNVTITIDEDVWSAATEIIEDFGMDTNTAIRMLLKRIIRDHNVSFLLEPQKQSAQVNQPYTAPIRETEIHKSQTPESNLQSPFETFSNHLVTMGGKNMTKSKAVALFKQRGVNFYGSKITFASKNNPYSFYWANPKFELLNKNWYFILNDYIKNELHLFHIPANAISEDLLIPRSDKPDLIDIQIYYGDPTFTDSRSKFSFRKFHVDTISY